MPVKKLFDVGQREVFFFIYVRKLKMLLRKTDWIPLKYELTVNIKDRLTF